MYKTPRNIKFIREVTKNGEGKGRAIKENFYFLTTKFRRTLSWRGGGI